MDRVLVQYTDGLVEDGFVEIFNPHERAIRISVPPDPFSTKRVALDKISTIAYLQTEERRASRGDRSDVPRLSAALLSVHLSNGAVIVGREAGVVPEVGFWVVPEERGSTLLRVFVPWSATRWVEALGGSPSLVLALGAEALRQKPSITERSHPRRPPTPRAPMSSTDFAGAGADADIVSILPVESWIDEFDSSGFLPSRQAVEPDLEAYGDPWGGGRTTPAVRTVAREKPQEAPSAIDDALLEYLRNGR